MRLFKEIQERNAELREALEHQTATAEVLGIISRSPTDVQPVLDAIVESAAKVCGIDDVVLRLREGERHGSAGSFWFHARPAVSKSVLMSHSFAGCASMARFTFPTPVRRTISNGGLPAASRTFLVVPLRQQGELIGTLAARRIEVRPFTPAQIKLLETFADQAVIAIENVRLFQELKESLEQQTATSEILGVIASSPTDIQPVLDAIAENAARCVNSDDATIRLLDGDERYLASHFGRYTPGVEVGEACRPSVAMRLCSQRMDNSALAETLQSVTSASMSRTARRAWGSEVRSIRSMCSRTASRTPLLREGTPIGVINIRRTEVQSVYGQADRAAENLRLSSRHRHRKRAAVQRNPGAQRGTARGAGASDGDVRGARHHQPVADRRAAGARCHRRERGKGLWD